MFKKITQPYDYKIKVAKTGLATIFVTARCMSGEQIGKRGGEDLRIEIDDLKLREVPAKDKPQYKDIPPSWNGTKLKELKKTVIFILWLNKGEHAIKFIPYQGAVIEEEPKIEFIQNTSQIDFNFEELCMKLSSEGKEVDLQDMA